MEPKARALRVLGLALGACLVLAYFVCQWLEPHGPAEFAYQPFTPIPLPYAAIRGFTYEQLWGQVRRIALLGPGLLLVVWGLSTWLKPQAPQRLRRALWVSVGACLSLTAVL